MHLDFSCQEACVGIGLLHHVRVMACLRHASESHELLPSSSLLERLASVVLQIDVQNHQRVTIRAILFEIYIFTAVLCVVAGQPSTPHQAHP